MNMAPRKDIFEPILARPQHFVGAGHKGGRGPALAVTALIHLGAVLALLAGLAASRQLAPPVLSVQLHITRHKQELVTLPPPKFAPPIPATAPPPQIVIQTLPSPAPTAPRTVPQAPPSSPVSQGAGTGEGRDSFLGRLLAQLNHFKRYPPGARKAHIQGVVMVHFVMDASGTVLSVEIAKSSGRPVLDEEALALLRRAQPLPALPANFPTPTLDAVVPIEFHLNT